jgi:hypothetical protein
LKEGRGLESIIMSLVKREHAEKQAGAELMFHLV